MYGKTTPKPKAKRRPTLTPRTRRLYARNHVLKALSELVLAQAEAVSDGLKPDSASRIALTKAESACMGALAATAPGTHWLDPKVPARKLKAKPTR
jgi:hypothetical protein